MNIAKVIVYKLKNVVIGKDMNKESKKVNNQEQDKKDKIEIIIVIPN